MPKAQINQEGDVAERLHPHDLRNWQPTGRYHWKVLLAMLGLILFGYVAGAWFMYDSMSKEARLLETQLQAVVDSNDKCQKSLAGAVDVEVAEVKRRKECEAAALEQSLSCTVDLSRCTRSLIKCWEAAKR